MRVGITCMIEYSVFSSGLTNTSIAVAELFKGLGHSVTLINVHGKKDWWDDCTAVKKIYDVLQLVDISGSNVPKFDIVFEIANLTLPSAVRSAIATKAIWILRKPFVLNELESTIYPLMTPERDLSGITEAWLLRDITAPDDVSLLETFSRVKVRTVPFVWTPILAHVHNNSSGSKQWKGNSNSKFFVRMADTNQSSASSSTIPLVILREVARRKLPIEGWALHNGENIAKSRFFRDNVLKHCSDLDLSGQCVGRQRSVDWVRDDNIVALVNIRFNRIRPILLDLAWVGIPVIHNSPAFRDIGCGAERFYYSDNSVEEGARAFETMVNDLKESKGWFSNANERREKILRNWSPISPEVRMGWLQAVAEVVGNTAVLNSVPTISRNVHVPAESTADSVAESVAKSTLKDVFTVVFSDMWAEFQPNYNFFTLLLNETGKTMNPPRTVIGVDEKDYDKSKQPDLVIFGPFGENWKKFHNVPKVHFTGENTRPYREPGVSMSLAFDHNDMVSVSEYMRLPLWILSINWFGADVEKLVNPKPIPLECCTRTYEKTLEDRKKFCAFVVTNPTNPVRNQAFHSLNTYKPVDSAGGLFNNVGNELAAFQGGGGGEWKKTKFLMNYKFCLTYENAKNSGYCTEKFLHAKAAGCVPIYWGDPDAQRDIDMDGVIDARKFRTPDELISAVKEIDTNDALWLEKATKPALNSYTVERVRRTLSELSKQLWKHIGMTTDDVQTIPRFIGAEPGSEQARVGLEYFDSVVSNVVVNTVAPSVVAPELPLAVTYVTWNFLGSLQHWLNALNTQRAVFPDLKALVFVGPDVPDETLNAISLKYEMAIFERVPSTWTPPNFSDFWEPTHYAWKIWIYHTVVNRESLKGKMILYMDAGSLMCRWPVEWMLKAQEHGICFLEDSREENDRWCGPTFCDLLKVTDKERLEKQIVAGILSFRSGHEVAVAFFNEAFKHAQVRDILVGPRLSGVDSNGKSYGHRQDQSVLSILVRRYNVGFYPLDRVYGDKSMRKTFEAKQAIYVHRGNFQKHIQFLPGIDDAYIINLDRRKDRLEKFWATHPELEGRVERWPATDGKSLTMTPELAKLFAPNDFYWKKAVMGCAISHLGLWWKLVNDNPDIQNFLIFEDDAKLVPGWQEVVSKSMVHAPENYDVLYLGGILPPNRQGYEKLLEPVTKYYNRIKPHQFFGQPVPTRYFHSCAYAYILSRRGAFKIMESIQAKSGYWTSADHMMCTPCDKLNLYFLNTPVAGCFQDDDPAYANSDFNNFSRVDKFDSDLWNNDERFNREEIGKSLNVLEKVEFEASTLLKSVFNKPLKVSQVEPVQTVSTVQTVQTVSTVSTVSTVQTVQTVSTVQTLTIPPVTILSNTKAIPIRFICLKKHALDFSKLYECEWLFTLLGGLTSVTIEYVDLSSAVPSDCPIFILQRPYVLEATKLLLQWSKAGARFKILHLSDEGQDNERDPLIIYSVPNCIGVLRTYIRDDFPKGTEHKIKVIPLGYRWSPLNTRENPLRRTPNLPFRENHWCFFGTDWNGRSALLKPLTDTKLLNSYKFYPKWNDPSSLSREEYIMEMTNSIFVPCPDGINPETFRFYEALEAGCIPLVVKTTKNEAWFRWVSNYIPLMANDSWEDVVRIMVTLLSKPERLEVYRVEILNGWWNWTKSLKEQAVQWMISS